MIGPVKPEGMSQEMFEHQLRVVGKLTNRYGMARLMDIDTYTYTLNAGGFITWDITRAKAWVVDTVRDGGPDAVEQMEVPPEQLAHIATRWEIDQRFVETAEPTRPGIAAPIIDHSEDPPVVCYILIDGVHRATKAHRSGIAFSAVVLPEAVSRDCILEAPEGVIP